METFEQFMTRCLFDPKTGYYSKNIRSIGSRGDFTTAPQLSEAPAKAIANWIAEAQRSHKTSNLIEIGPGLGTLSLSVIKQLPFWTRLRSNFHLVESSEVLSKHQRKTLGDKATIHRNVFDALDACSGNAIIFSNELVDAFPVRLFERSGSDWMEVAIDHSQGYPKERLIQPDQLPASSVFETHFPESQRVEVHESYRIWLESWLPLWKRGKMLTIDYGDRSANIYKRRPAGTLRAYLLHQCQHGEQVYLNPGLQDITADVNFTDLEEWSKPWLENDRLQNMADFIRPYCSKNERDLMEAASHFLCLEQSRT